MEEEAALGLGTAFLGGPQSLSHGEGRNTWDVSGHPTHIAYVYRRHGAENRQWVVTNYSPMGIYVVLDLMETSSQLGNPFSKGE